jgi:hypothetical protein
MMTYHVECRIAIGVPRRQIKMPCVPQQIDCSLGISFKGKRQRGVAIPVCFPVIGR